MKPKGVTDLPGLGDYEPAELALRFVISNPHVDVALSGMGSVSMVEQNVSAVEKGPLEPSQIRALNALMDRYHELAKLYCTGCEYCMPCPSGVNIPRCFELYTYLTVYGLEQYALEQYTQLVSEGKDAAQCTECETCLERCPQQIAIPSQLKQVAQALHR